MKQISLLLVLLCLSFAGYSQITAATYGFTASSGTFTSIAPTGTLPPVSSYPYTLNWDDVTSDPINIGFNFEFCGVTYTQLTACSNGWLSLAGYPSSYGYNSLGSVSGVAGGVGLLMPLWDDLDGGAYTAATGSTYYTTVGVAPNRKFIFEWNGFERYGYSGAGSQDFQVILYETTNQIDFVYNNGTLTSNDLTVGIANSGSDWQTLSDVSSAPTASSTSFFDYIYNSPANGQIYSWTPPPPCTGTPVAGTAVADVATACITDNITLSVTGTTAATGLTFQWQSSPDFSTWTNIPGATNSTSVTTETMDMYYRVVVTCPGSGSFDISTTTSVTFSPVCYCNTGLYYYYPATYTYAGALGLFDITGEAGSTISDAGPATVPADGYENRTGISVDMQQGNTYSGNLNYSYSVYTYASQIWIDYNDDGIFDISELATPVIYTSSYSSSDPFSITVPITAPLGSHRMRVRYTDLQYSSVPSEMDPCNNFDMSLGYSTYYYYGVTRDYTVNILAAPSCTGTPSGGTATSSATLACPATAFTLGSTGLTVAAGLTYQWQESTSATGPWTDISGATSPTYSNVITSPTYFQLVVNCPASSTSGTSTPVFVNYFGFCYCVPSYSNSPASPSYEGIDIYNLTGYAGSSISDGGTSPQPTNGYDDRTTISVDLQQGDTYTGDISYHDGWNAYESQIWIDFNNDGVFDISEEVTAPIYSSPYSYFDVYTMNIPITAAVGTHRMRVRYSVMYYGSSTSADMDPCALSDASGNTYTYGMTRDYIANIIAAPPCSGAPAGGTATASTTLACPSTAFTLNSTGTSTATGLTYQWQSSVSVGGPYADIAGATSLIYSNVETAPTYYQIVVTCSATSLSGTSTPVFVNYFGYCFCTPSYVYSPAATSYGLDVVSLTGYAGSTLSDAGPATIPASGYEDMTSVPAVDLQQGGVYTGNLSYSSGGYEYENQIWIDFNNNGVFDVSEEVTPVIGTGLCSSYITSDGYTLSIPMTAAVGLHRMRVRNAYTYDCGLSSDMDPCNSYDAMYNYYYGMTRDYMANIIALPACTGAPVVGTAAASPTSGGVSIPFTLSLPGLSMAAGLTFQWQSATSATGPWTDITGATNNTYSFISIFNDMWYQCVVVCTLSSTSTTSTPAMITYVATPPCYPGSSSWSYAGGTYAGIDEFHVAGFAGSNLDDIGLNAVVSTTTGYLDHTTLAPITMEQGGVYASSGLWYSTYDHQELQVWIDFNDNGIFETTEEVSPVSGFDPSFTSNPTNFNISIPAGGALGTHNMRVRAIWEQYPGGSSAPLHLDPCNMSYLGTSPSYYSGDAIDYRVYIIPHCLFTSTAAASAAVCPNSPFNLTGTTTAPSYSWSGPGGFTSTLLNPTVPGAATVGVYSFTATDGTCTLTMTATQPLLPTSPIPVVTPAPATVCNGSSVTLTATVPGLPGTPILTEDFNAGLGTWTVDNTGSTSPAALSPWQGEPDGYTYGFGTTFHSPDNSPFVITNADVSGSSSYTTVSSLISPTFSLAGFASVALSFQHYLHAYYMDNVVSVDISTDGGVTWSLIHDYATITTGTATSFVTDNYDLTPYAGSTNCQLRFYYNTNYGYYWAVDNVSLTGTPIVGPAPVWTPSTYLFSDPALTTPYVAGTAAYEVYVHPTTVLTTTAVDYIAGTTLGTCSSFDTSTVTITAPPAITTATGSNYVCAGSNLTLSNTTTGGTWTTSNTTVATVTAGGVIQGVAAGADTVFYTVGGCVTFTVINVSTFVTTTTGSTVICSGLSTTLTNPTTGGTWTSSNAGVATVSSGGVVTMGTAGTAIITYTLPTGCADTSLVTSVAPPAAIGGGTSVCYNGGTTTLTESTTGGTWTTSTGTIATISAATGSPITVTGLTAGTANITYTTIPGCMATKSLTLNANPANITGTMAVCASGGATTLSDATGSGTWASGNVFRATVNSSGVVTGVTSGTVVISYTAVNGCFDTALVTVNALPAAITGTTTICNLASTTLADASTPGTWSTSTPTITTVNASGMVTGVTSGSGTIIFTQTSTGCSRSTTVTVNALPGAISGVTSMCNNTTTTLTSSPSGGTWTSGSPAIASIEAGTGIVHALSVGTANITLTNGSGCQAYSTMTVNPSFVPTVTINANPGTTVCAGSTVTYTPTITNGGTAPTYSWTVNGSPMSAASSYSYVPVTGDVVGVSIVSNLSCAVPATASGSVTMTVDPIVTPALTLATAYTDTGCAGAFTTVYTHPVSAGTGATFQWYVNGSPVSGTSNYTYLATNGDVVTAVMTSTAGCLSGSTAVVTSASLTLDIIPFVVPDVTLTSSTGATSCGGSIVVYNTTETNGGGSPAYLWTVNGVAVATGPTYFYVPANGDMVVVRMTSSYPCVAPTSDTAQMTMTVGTTVTPVATIAAHPGTTITLGMTDTFTVTLVSGGGAAPAYQWYINGVPVSGANGTTFITSLLVSGDLVTCHVTNTDLCGGTTISNVLAMSVLGSGGVNVNNVSGGEASISLVPNPNNGSFIVKGNLGLSSNEDMTLEVTNMLGQVVYTGHTEAKNGEFNEQVKLNGILANGSYVLSVRSQHMSKIFHFVLEQK
ncbi:beta strand repeat-containing protein [Flavipsychrobacter stenotrophus]|nr:GEVED domain-containing protein [Flavipsychrobacter stenotrophus]